MRRLSVFLAALALSLVGCSEDGTSDADAQNWVADAQTAVTGNYFLDDNEILRAKIPYEQITLERSHCNGPCPAYRVIFRREGTATLVLEPDSEEFREVYVGSIDLRTYVRLALMVEAARRSATWSKYSAKWSDDYEATVTAGDLQYSWVVSDYGEVAPLDIWALGTL